MASEYERYFPVESLKEALADAGLTMEYSKIYKEFHLAPKEYLKEQNEKAKQTLVSHGYSEEDAERIINGPDVEF